MNVYTSVSETTNSKNLESASLVGVVLTGDKNQIYMQDGFKLTIQDDISAHVYGLKRAISFVKNMKPLYCNNSMIHFALDKVDPELLDKIKTRIDHDEYIQRFLEERNFTIMQAKEFSAFDKEMLMVAGLQISPRSFKKGYER